MNELIKYDLLKKMLLEDDKFISLSKLLPRAANKWPNKISLICQNKNEYEQITYKELYNKAKLCAQKFIDLGISKKDRVIIYYENSVAFFCAYFGLWHIGAIPIPLNVYLTTNEIEKIVIDANPKAIIVSNTLNENLPSIDNNTIILKDILDIINQNKNIVLDTIDNNDDDIAAILYTSGTTGSAKGVMLTAKNIITNVLQGMSRFEMNPDEIVYCPLPLFHSLPQNMCVWLNVIAGIGAITVSKVDRTTLTKAFEHKPTFIVTVPAMYGLFCKLRNLDFSSYRYCFSGGDILPDKIQKYFELIYRRKISNGFGMTETSPFISININEGTTNISNVGKPFLGISIEIRDENDKILPRNTIGTIWLSGDNVMKGYYNAPEATSMILKNNWLNTGDLGYLNESGEIIISGRAKDLIINKGLKIYPQEIETVLYKHPEVLQAAVVGKKEVDNNEIPIAFVATNSKNIEQLEKELKILSENNLASYKIPRQFIIKNELPMTATGKIDKKELRKF